MAGELLRVTASSLNLRKQASLQASVLGFLNKGEVVRWLGGSMDQWLHVRAHDGKEGWASGTYLEAHGDGVGAAEVFPWMAIAITEKGTAEIAGPSANPRIVEYLKSTPYAPGVDRDSDETAWCSAFVNWCMEQAGYAGTESAWALNWAKWGKKIDQPVRGCVTVFERFYESKGVIKKGGHVGFYLKDTEADVTVLGGNQGNRVSEAAYPKNSVAPNDPDGTGYRLVAYRIPG